jgi:hypothetical protein
MRSLVRFPLVCAFANDYHPMQMNGVHRARVPGSFYFLLAVALLIGISVFSYFYVRIHERAEELGKAQQEMKVWTNKSTGFYYCPDSPNYGQTDSGQYMTQNEALRNGYTAALNEPCR